jgi:hypothetical protein
MDIQLFSRAFKRNRPWQAACEGPCPTARADPDPGAAEVGERADIA